MKWILMLVLIAVGLALALLLMGCTMTQVKVDKHGTWAIKRTSFMQQIQILEVSISTNGTASMRGYRTDGGTAAAAIIGGAIAEGAVKGTLRP